MAENNSSAPLKTVEGAVLSLPYPELWRDSKGIRGYTADPGQGPWFTADQMLAYAAQAVAAQAAPAAPDTNRLRAEILEHASKGSRLVRTLFNEPTGTLSDVEVGDWIQRAQQYLTLPSQAAPAAVAVPPKAITASLMLDDGGERPVFCLMAAYPSEADARAALAALAATPALPATEDSSAGDLAEAVPARQFICPTKTVADLVNNLLLLDQSLPIYGAQYIDHPVRKRCAIAVPPTVSRERVQDGRWIGQGDELNAAVIWTRAEQPAQAEVQAEPVAWRYKRRGDCFGDFWFKPAGQSADDLRTGRGEGKVFARCPDHYDWTPLYTAPQAQPADALDAAPAAPINSEALQVIKALREWVMAVPADVAAALPAMPGIDADWMDAVEAALATHSAPADGLMVDMTPPATSRDRWMYNQGRLAEVERICAAIKTEDDYCVDQGDYMLDSDDCIKVARGTWLRPTYDRAAMAAAQEGGNASVGKDGAA